MRVLVAGGAGFIGSHLTERLLGDGHEVLVLDNLSTGRLANLASLRANPRLTFLECDIVAPLPGLPRVDQVYQLASPASPPGYKRYPLETLRVNSEGTLHLLEKAQADRAGFLLASTSEAYGDPLEHPQREDYRGNVSSTGPRSMYDEGKRYAEALTMVFARDRGVDARVVRIFNTYGPRSDPFDGRLVPNFVRQALSGEAMTVYGDGAQTRSLCYVSDLVEGLVRAMGCWSCTGEVMNLGNPEEHTILEFASLIRVLAGSTSQLTFVEPAVGDDPQRRQPAIEKANRMLGWMPQVGLREGLDRTIEWFRSELRLPALANAR
ncbi:MAG: NAD-dependent epimerase/dehydratase family protein [Dehalococcoidia bacterium]